VSLAQSQLEQVQDTIEEVVRMLRHVRDDVDQLRISTGCTALDVEHYLAGSATAADRQMTGSLEDARQASELTIGAIDNAMHALTHASQGL
jgi:hypothetical protein